MPGTLAPDRASLRARNNWPRPSARFLPPRRRSNAPISDLGQEVSRLQRELAQERDLRQRREALAEVSAILAHEIRNPLGSLELFYWPAGGLCASGQRETVGAAGAVRNTNRLGDCQQHSRVSRSGELTLQPTDLHSILCSVQALLAPAARNGSRYGGSRNCTPRNYGYRLTGNGWSRSS